MAKHLSDELLILCGPSNGNNQIVDELTTEIGFLRPFYRDNANTNSIKSFSGGMAILSELFGWVIKLRSSCSSFVDLYFGWLVYPDCLWDVQTLFFTMDTRYSRDDGFGRGRCFSLNRGSRICIQPFKFQGCRCHTGHHWSQQQGSIYRIFSKTALIRGTTRTHQIPEKSNLYNSVVLETLHALLSLGCRWCLGL